MNRVIENDMREIVAEPLPWEQFAGATVLITGGSGFLPAYMVETLLYLNREVLSKPCSIIVYVRDWTRAMERFGRDTEVDVRVRHVQRQYDPIYANYVIHAASNASPRVYMDDPISTIEANTIGTVNMLNLCKKQSGCRGFLFFSSGDAATTPDPLDPRSCYSESKRMGETMCAAWARQYGVPAKIVRISHTYGPGMKLDDGRVFADFTRDIINGGPIVVNSDGMARRPFLYLSDATNAFFTVLLKGQVAIAYNVANPQQMVSIDELAERLGKEFNIAVQRAESPVGSHSAISMPQSDSGVVANIEKTQALGWTPVVGIEEGFRRTVASYA
jgi:UDP-glucuronate decarboxylase